MLVAQSAAGWKSLGFFHPISGRAQAILVLVHLWTANTSLLLCLDRWCECRVAPVTHGRARRRHGIERGGHHLHPGIIQRQKVTQVGAAGTPVVPAPVCVLICLDVLGVIVSGCSSTSCNLLRSLDCSPVVVFAQFLVTCRLLSGLICGRLSWHFCALGAEHVDVDHPNVVGHSRAHCGGY